MLKLQEQGFVINFVGIGFQSFTRLLMRCPAVGHHRLNNGNLIIIHGCNLLLKKMKRDKTKLNFLSSLLAIANTTEKRISQIKAAVLK